MWPAPRPPRRAGIPAGACPAPWRSRTLARVRHLGLVADQRTESEPAIKTNTSARPTVLRHTCAGAMSATGKYAMSVSASPARATAASAASTKDPLAGNRPSSGVCDKNTSRGGSGSLRMTPQHPRPQPIAAGDRPATTLVPIRRLTPPDYRQHPPGPRCRADVQQPRMLGAGSR
jgi:hypothetical protein